MKLFPSILCMTALFFSIQAFAQDEPRHITVQHVSSLESRAHLFESRPEIPREGREVNDGHSKSRVLNSLKSCPSDDHTVLDGETHRNHTGGFERSLRFTPRMNATPPDPTLAVGKNHVMVVYNEGVKIYDKQGNRDFQDISLKNIFCEGNCRVGAGRPFGAPSNGTIANHDPTVLYDVAAGVWVVSMMRDASEDPGNNDWGGMTVAVSSGPNPINSSWYVYYIDYVNDFAKISVWRDGYYITSKNDTDDGLALGNAVYVLERSKMLAGDIPRLQTFVLPDLYTNDDFYGVQILSVTDGKLPSHGGATAVYIQDDAWCESGLNSEDQIKLWTIDVDWDDESKSNVTGPQRIFNKNFKTRLGNGDQRDLKQQNYGQKIDANQAIIGNQAQFRKFEDYNSSVFCFAVDVDNSEEKLAGVRWVELRQDNENELWEIHQEGTYCAPDKRHAWLPSIAMDKHGNIGMGYSSMSGPNSKDKNVKVGSYFVTRLKNDKEGFMTSSEKVIKKGTGFYDEERYGDYSKMALDPVTDASFWFITELMIGGVRSGAVGRFVVEPSSVRKYFFENGRQGWSDPGLGCDRVDSFNSPEGDYSMRLKNGFESSKTASPTLDLSESTMVNFKFSFKSRNLDLDEYFDVQFYDGSDYHKIARYKKGVDFNNNVVTTKQITIKCGEHSFNSSNKFRFKLHGDTNGDRVFFDQVIISTQKEPTAIVRQPSSSTPLLIKTGENIADFTATNAGKINIYPNPSDSVLNIAIADVEFDDIRVYSVTGALVKIISNVSNRMSLDVSNFAPGMYFLHFDSDGFVINKRFVKK